MFIIVHYSEIGLKGKNRVFFEKKLVDNIDKARKGVKKIYRRYGRIVVELGNKANFKQIISRYSLLPGISSFAFAEKTALKMSSIENTALKILSDYSQLIWSTFRITTTRSNKNFPKNSSEINIILGDLIREKLDKKVNLGNPDMTLFVEISEKEAFLYTRKYPGLGGLPVGSSGKAIALLSGGIDSPVASFLAMKRGLEVIFVHMLNKTMIGRRLGTEKIEKIVKVLTKFQGDSKLYIVPFEEIQKAIIAQVPAQLRMIVYRRFMLKIAAKIAAKEKANGLITGDSIGQVASQTLPNLKCAYESTDLPVLPPLIGMNKEEIIEIAKKIGTYELSIIPYPDCCSFMIAKHPETGGKVENIREAENLIAGKEKLIENCVSDANVKLITGNE